MEPNIQPQGHPSTGSGQEQPLSKKQRRRLERMERKAQEAKAQSSSKMWRRLGIWVVVLGILSLIVWGVVKLAQTSPDSPTTGTADPITAADWTKGNPNAPVTLIEYSDLQCPACKSYYPFVKQLMEEYGDKVYFAYRHFPLRTIHKNAALAAQAAEAAGLQEQFWAYHDILFEKQTEWASLFDPDKKFEEYATALGLDIVKFKSDVTSDAVKAEVAADEASGEKANVLGTPSFYLNGTLVANPPRNLQEFKIMIDNAASKATTVPVATTTPATTTP